MSPPVLRSAAAADVEDALESVAPFTQSPPVLQRDIRRHLLRRFPYGLFYRLVQDQVVVVACFHAKRSPRAWRSRY